MYADLANTLEDKCVVIVDTEGGYKGNSGVKVQLSEALANVVGGNRMSRFVVIQRLICYILLKRLQDTENKMIIRCDERLAMVFSTKMFRLTGLAKFLKNHISVGRRA